VKRDLPPGAEVREKLACPDGLLAAADLGLCLDLPVLNDLALSDGARTALVAASRVAGYHPEAEAELEALSPSS